MKTCLNCDHENADAAKHCLSCGANLETKKYAKKDDPIDPLRKDVDAIKKHLQEQEDARAKKEADEAEEAKGKPAGSPKAPKPRRTLFGD